MQLKVTKELEKTFNTEELEFLNIYTKKKEKRSINEIIDFKNFDSNFIISIPHSGLLIPELFYSSFDLNSDLLIEIDMLSNLLYEFNKGTIIKSNIPPFLVDMNRSDIINNKENIPYHLQNNPFNYFSIKNKPVLEKKHNEIQLKILKKIYNLYHQLLTEKIKDMISKYGFAFVLDGHSMTSIGLGRVFDKNEKRADFVMGTLNDTSADKNIINTFYESLYSNCKKHNFLIEKNKPYSGGFITRKHANPQQNVHVIQLEVSMKTYMTEGFNENKENIYKLKKEKIKIIKEMILKAVLNSVEKGKEIYKNR